MGGTKHSGLVEGTIKSPKSTDDIKGTFTNLTKQPAAYNMFIGWDLVNRSSLGVTREIQEQVYKSMQENLPNALQYLKEACEFLGLHPEDMPYANVLIQGRNSRGVLGECSMMGGVYLYANALSSYNYMGLPQSPSLTTLSHEYVHAIEGWIIQNTLSSYNQGTAWIDRTFAKDVCLTALAKVTGEPKHTSWNSDAKFDWSICARTIQRRPGDIYASSTPSETIAVAMQCHLMGKYSEYGEAVLQAFKQQIAEVYAKKHKK